MITTKAWECVGMRVLDMKVREPIKDIKRLEGKRPLEKHGPEWEDNIKFVCLPKGEIASERTSLVYSRCLKRRRCFEHCNKLQYKKDANLWLVEYMSLKICKLQERQHVRNMILLQKLIVIKPKEGSVVRFDPWARRFNFTINNLNSGVAALYLGNFGRAFSFVLVSEANFCTSESDFKCEKKIWIIKIYFGSVRDWTNASMWPGNMSMPKTMIFQWNKWYKFYSDCSFNFYDLGTIILYGAYVEACVISDHMSFQRRSSRCICEYPRDNSLNYDDSDLESLLIYIYIYTNKNKCHFSHKLPSVILFFTCRRNMKNDIDWFIICKKEKETLLLEPKFWKLKNKDSSL